MRAQRLLRDVEFLVSRTDKTLLGLESHCRDIATFDGDSLIEDGACAVVVAACQAAFQSGHNRARRFTSVVCRSGATAAAVASNNLSAPREATSWMPTGIPAGPASPGNVMHGV